MGPIRPASSAWARISYRDCKERAVSSEFIDLWEASVMSWKPCINTSDPLLYFNRFSTIKCIQIHVHIKLKCQEEGQKQEQVPLQSILAVMKQLKQLQRKPRKKYYFFSIFFSNCFSCFITTRITFTCTLCPQFIYMICIIFTLSLALKDFVSTAHKKQIVTQLLVVYSFVRSSFTCAVFVVFVYWAKGSGIVEMLFVKMR